MSQRIMPFNSIIFCLLLFSLGNVIHAQVQVNGIILDQVGHPVGDANISISPGDQQGFSKRDGSFQLLLSEGGSYRITVNHINFSPLVSTISIPPDSQVFRLELQFMTERFYAIDGYTVTATKSIRRPESIPQPIAFVDQTTVRDEYFRNSGDMLDELPGIRVIRRGGSIGTDQGVSIRSLNGGPSSNKSLVLIDGLPQNNGWDGGVNFNALPSENVARLEVLKGPASALYGSQATAGVINILTPIPTEGWGASFAATGELDAAEDISNPDSDGYDRPLVYGSELQFQGSFAADKAWHRLSASQRYGENQYSQSDLTDRWQNANLAYQYGRSMGSDLQVKARLNYHYDRWDSPKLDDSQQEYQQAGFALGGSYNSQQGFFDVNLYANIFRGNEKGISGNWSSAVDSERFGTILNYKNALFSGRGIINTGIDFAYDEARDRSEQSLSEIEFVGLDTVEVNDRNEFVDLYNGTFYAENQLYTYATYNLAFYFQYEQRFWQSVNLTAGFRIDQHQQFGDVFSPKLGATWQIWQAGDYRTTLKANYGQGFRSPTLQDLYSRSLNGYGDKDLQPEKTRNLDFGLLQRLSDWGYFEVSYFSMEVENLLINDRIGQSGNGYYVRYSTQPEVETDSQDLVLQRFNKRLNLGAYRPSGLELSLKLEPFAWLTYQGAYSFLDPQDYTFQTSAHSFYQRLSLRAAVNSDLTLAGSIDHQYTGDGYFFDFERNPYESYHLVNTRLSATVWQNYRLSLIVSNLADTRYRQWHYAWQPGRTIITRFEVRL
jgi:outer membrane cobalamin receptor